MIKKMEEKKKSMENHFCGPALKLASKVVNLFGDFEDLENVIDRKPRDEATHSNFCTICALESHRSLLTGVPDNIDSIDRVAQPKSTVKVKKIRRNRCR
jgi:hypothetical protein